MKKIIQFVEKLEPYSRPNSFISYLDNILAILIFGLFLGIIKKVKWLSSPSIATTSSLVLGLAAASGYFFGQWRYLFVLSAGLAYTFDNIDGIWARYFNVASAFGGWYDSVNDRIKDTAILCAFAFSFQKSPFSIFFITALILFLIDLIASLEAAKYLKPRSSIKIETAAQKKFRILAFGPAEALVLYSLIVLLPEAYKIIPVVIFCLAMILSLLKTRKAYEFK